MDQQANVIKVSSPFPFSGPTLSCCRSASSEIWCSNEKAAEKAPSVSENRPYRKLKATDACHLHQQGESVPTESIGPPNELLRIYTLRVTLTLLFHLFLRPFLCTSPFSLQSTLPCGCCQPLPASSVVAHACNPGAQEGEGGKGREDRLGGLHNEFQISLGYRVRPCPPC